MIKYFTFTFSLFFASVVSGQVSVTTDKTDYLPGENLIIKGNGWHAGEKVDLLLTESPTSVTHHFIVTADTRGQITYDKFRFNKKHKGVYFKLAAVGHLSGLRSETWFTDGSITVTSNTNWSSLDDPDIPGFQPPNNDDVIFVRNDAVLTVDVSNAVCAGIQLGISGGGKPGNGTLILNANAVLTVSGDVIMGFNSRKANGIVNFNSNATMIVEGNLTLGVAGGGNGKLDMASGGLLKIGGSFTAPGLDIFNPGTGSIEYNGAGAQSILSNSFLGSTPYYNLILGGSGNKTPDGDISVSHELTVNSNFYSGFNNLSGNGALTVNNGGSFHWAVESLPALSGVKTFNTNSTFEYYRDDIQTIGAYNYGNLVLTSSFPAIKTLTGNASVAADFKILNNSVCQTTSAYTLTILSTGSVNFVGSGTAYVDGKLASVYSAPGSKIFPLGKNGNFRPLRFSYTALTGNSTVTAEQIESVIPGPVPPGYTIQTDRHWVVSQTGGSNFIFDISLDGDPFIPGNNAPVIINGDGITNTLFAATFSTPEFIASGIPSLGNFAVGSVAEVCDDPVINNQPDDQSSCQGGSALFTVAASGSEPLNFQWYKSGTPAIAIHDGDDGGDIQITDNGTTLTINNLIAADAGDYFAVITSACGSAVNSSNASIAVQIPPDIADAGNDQTICPGNSVLLNANTPLSGAGTWSVISGPSTSSLQFSNASNPAAQFTPDGGDGIYILQWAISNPPCNPTTDEVEITVGSGLPLSIVCPANITTTTDHDGAGNCSTTETLGTPVISGNCGGSTLTASISGIIIDPSTYEFGIGSTIVTWVVTDGSGNSASCSQTVTVTDNEVPAISCPPDKNASTNDDGAGNCTTTVNLGTPSASDNCNILSVVATVGGVVIDPSTYLFSIGTTIVHWVASDDAGHTSSCSQNVVVSDNESPSITCPANITVACQSDVPDANTALVNAFDNCSGVSITYEGDIISGACGTGYEVTRTYKATDDAGNTSTCAQIITINTNTPPYAVSETGGSNKVIGLTRYTHELVIIDATTIELFSAAELILEGHSVHAAQTIVKHPQSGIYYAILRLNDLPDNRPLVTVDISTGVCTMVGELGDNFNSMTFSPDGKLYAVTDDYAIDPESLYMINSSDGSKTFLKKLGNGDEGDVIAFNKDDGFIYHWSGENDRVFEKIDTSAFTVTVIPYSGFDFNEVIGAVYRGNGNFLVSDITNINSVVGSNFVNLSTSGFAVSITYQEYNALRGFGNIGSEITQSSVVQCESDAQEPSQLPLVKDACGNILSPPIPVIGGSYNSCSGTKTYTYNFTDCSGQVYSWTYTYTIIDDISPVISCPAGSPFSRNTSGSVYTVSGNEFDAFATDNCDIPSLSWFVTGATSKNGSATIADVELNPGVNNIEWTASDACGNTSSCSVIVNVSEITTGTGETFSSEVEKQFGLKIRPNPSMNDFTLVREGTVNKKIAVVVFDVLGKIVYKKEISDTYSPIRFGEDFKTGIYFAVVTQGDKQKTVKLIKQ